MQISSPVSRSRALLTIGVTAGAALIFAVSLNFKGLGIGQAADHGAVTSAINRKAVELNVKPRSVELPSDKAMLVRKAIKQGDFATARRITAHVLADNHLQYWRYYPFSTFIEDVINVNDALLAKQLNAWVAQDKDDAIPLLIRAQYEYDTGWFVRGGYYASQTPTANMESYAVYMKKGIADVDAAMRLNDSIPYSDYLKLTLQRGISASQETVSTFEAAIAKYPGYYPLYTIILNTLQPKWGGSIPMMYSFVNRYAGTAPENSPLKLLYLDLYRDLLGIASTACNSYSDEADRMPQCVASAMQQIIRPDLEHPVLTALKLYDHTDKYEFSIAVEPLLFDMLKIAGGEAYSGAILQLAASAMHSDTQLVEDKPGHNNYVIDKAVAESWYLKKFYANALQKDSEALKDAETMTFPNAGEKDVALAGIYANIAGTCNKLNQYADMIAYEEAAEAIGGKTGDEQAICFGYYFLKDYDAAARVCSKIVEERADNSQARYWRALAYRDSGRTDAAVRDLGIVANSSDHYRTAAAIDLSVLYDKLGDYRRSLQVLNTYTYLYDADMNDKTDIAVSYNNRCYAYMQLGELKKALADCTQSLKYASLPDALRKQQELVRRLGGHAPGF